VVAGEVGAQLDQEIKSTDKLEIQMEEQNLVQKKDGENGIPVKNGDRQPGDDLSKEVAEEKPSKSPPKSAKKSKLTVKIPQILRRRTKERPRDDNVSHCNLLPPPSKFKPSLSVFRSV